MSSIYKNYSLDELQELYSNFLISSWSYSKVTQFARNEKAFEKVYIYGVHSKNSATTVAGQAYHKALEYYFAQKKEGKQLDIVELQESAFQYIKEVPANQWKLQKTTPTIEECIIKATDTVSKLLTNFMKEKGVYEDDLQEIIAVELNLVEFLTINGVDIPLPASMKIDLVIKTKEGKVAVIDHKSKAAFTDDEEIALSIGVQAITYVKGYEEHTGQQVDEVWFIENKYSQNKDGKPQLNAFKVSIDNNTRKLYEALLYEPLKRMMEAVSNPDYVYLINESDNFEDKAEIYDFWARTMICEVEDFNVEESKKELVSKRLKKIRDSSIQNVPPSVIKNFKENASKFIQFDLSKTNMAAEQKIEHVLNTFGIVTRVAHSFNGYSSNTYLLEISAGVPVKSVFNKRLDIANALDVANVRISSEMKVYEGKSYLAIEVAKKREKTLLFDENELHGYKIPLGKDNFENTIYWNLENPSTPHVLICGATGSGKSASLTSTIEYLRLAGVDDIIIFDPKHEFRHLHNNMDINVYSDIEEIEEQARIMVDEMNQRVRNHAFKYTALIFDEFADAFANAKKGPELNVYKMAFDGFYANGNPKSKKVLDKTLNSLEENLRILLQKGRSSGFRIIAATQRASVKVITGDAKVNFPVQICFRVPKEQDSRVVLDEPGAESLAGMGDGLIKSPEYNDTIRFQAFYKPAEKLQTA